ncbi:phospholipid-transporting ATPase VA-like [Engraulis encrasicolus]|uniref:phospholipid-transporting ATPase VA-like n=1 Tax=Engraulis encrasicolus TaxID=184585 RepID=UPI002FD272A5
MAWGALKRICGSTDDRNENKHRLVCSFPEDVEFAERLRSYKGNQIRTSKYTWLSFLPKNLFEQMHRFANIYFLFICALNFVPIVNAFQPAIAVLPLAVVMSITAVTNLWEDYRRQRSDRRINSLLCEVYDR